LTRIFSAPGSAPGSGATDCTIQSCGTSKLTVFAGSVKTFQAAALEPGEAEALADGAGAELAVAVALSVALLPAVQTGVPFPPLLQPARAAAATASAVAVRSTALRIPAVPDFLEGAVPVMVPA
jgi:hypothetical protein